MSLLPARLQINDPAFKLGEKVQPAKPEPAPCPIERPVSRLSAKGARDLDRVITARLSSNPAPQSSNPPALSSKLPASTSFGVDLGDPRGDLTAYFDAPTVKKFLTPDPDGWTPHDGGPCPYAAFEQAAYSYPDVVPVSRELRNKIERGDEVELPTEADEWIENGWTPHDGGPCPVAPDVLLFVRFRDGWEDTQKTLAEDWSWEHSRVAGDIVAYKLATPPEALNPLNTDPNGPGTDAWKLKVQQQRQLATQPKAPKKKDMHPLAFQGHLAHQQWRQRMGLPVEWDKVPVGSKVWVRDDARYYWTTRYFIRRDSGRFRASKWIDDGLGHPWAQCKLFIEGVEP